MALCLDLHLPENTNLDLIMVGLMGLIVGLVIMGLNVDLIMLVLMGLMVGVIMMGLMRLMKTRSWWVWWV